MKLSPDLDPICTFSFSPNKKLTCLESIGMWQTISNLLLDISTVNQAFYELSFVTGAAGSASKGARTGPPLTWFSWLGTVGPHT